VKRSGQTLPLRETTLVVALVNHPDLIDRFFHEVETLDVASTDLKRLHGAVIDAFAHGRSETRDAMLAAIEAAGLTEVWTRAVDHVRRAGLWSALEDAAPEDARDAFAQALHLQRAAHNLHRELKAAEATLAAEPTEENYLHLIEVQAQFRNLQATEALIEGFGILSGKVDKT
jgi:DNA primase